MAQKNTFERPSVVSLAKLFSRIVSAAVVRALTYPFRSLKAQSLKMDILNAAVRTLLAHITLPQARWLNTSTTERYLSFCKIQKQRPSSVSVAYSYPAGEGEGKGEVVGHWIGDPAAEKVVLYCHGGAYFQPATSGTFLYLDDLLQNIEKNEGKKRVAALVVACTLAPEAAFPTQIREAAAILNHVLETNLGSRKRRARDVFLAGDSAGGNIVLGLLGHLMRPRPDVQDMHLEGRLGGAVLYSPSVTASADWASMRRNEERDMLSVAKVPVWAAMYMGRTASLQSLPLTELGMDAYSEPCTAESEWWITLPKVVGDVLVVSGADEVFADAIAQLGARMMEGWVQGGGREDGVLCVAATGEAHIWPIVGFMMRRGRKEEGSQGVMERWWKMRLLEG
ncbi:alpha/beta-hydrolase [Bimuria novae-zelandiae CBS 107.79]|uniref:Alpha/beta-hydrolase n=1 Tax=Bimuria novae-zelandiae CBS 107.79 TaxID=1447943 RepID=A0A6A5VCU7_9PLEO|nr:alpha/beta-hydrolase [Bimuria novae-zelandiae CBS 107.79]